MHAAGDEGQRRGAGRRHLLRLVGAGAAAVSAMVAGAQPPTRAQAAGGIVGSWLVRQRVPSGLIPFNAFTVSFLSDGIAVAQGLGGGPNPARMALSASVGNGVWQQTGDATFGFTLPHVRYLAETGEPSAYFKWVGDATLAPDGNALDLAYRSNPFDPVTLQPEMMRPLLQAKGVRITLDPDRG